MSFKIILCFLVIFAVAQQILGHYVNKKRYNKNGHRRFGNMFVYGGKSYEDTEHKSITNGKLDKSKMIEVVIESSGGLCGGTIIGDKFIITAAHCFVATTFCSGADERQIYISFFLNISTFFSKVKAAIPHPTELQVHIEGICHSYEGKKCAPEDEGKLIGVKTLYILQEYYNKNCTSGDLAILELSEVIGDHGATISDSIELPTSGDFVVSGFGEDPENDVDTGHTLKTVTLTAQKCDENHGNYDSVCTVEIDKDVCRGDSGGALVDKNNVIVGIVSSGRDCAVLYESVENNKSENSPLKQWEGGIFTSTSLHYGFICDIVGTKGCPKTFNKEPYLTIS